MKLNQLIRDGKSVIAGIENANKHISSLEDKVEELTDTLHNRNEHIDRLETELADEKAEKQWHGMDLPPTKGVLVLVKTSADVIMLAHHDGSGWFQGDMRLRASLKAWTHVPG